MKKDSFEKQLRDVEKSLDKFSKQLPEITKKRMYEIGLEGMAISQKNCPQDTSNARRSHYLSDTESVTGGQGFSGSKSKEILATRINQFKRKVKKGYQVFWIGVSAEYAAAINNEKKNYTVGGAGFFTKGLKHIIKEYKKEVKKSWDEAEEKS